MEHDSKQVTLQLNWPSWSNRSAPKRRFHLKKWLKSAFVSHETYTPAKGGPAAAEIEGLREVFKDAANQIVICNTKGFTGHPMGAGLEDALAVKAG